MNINFMIFGTLLWCILDIIFFYLMSYRLSKKCNYDCSKCEDWHCNAYWCLKRKEKNIK